MVTREDLDKSLRVVAQFEMKDGFLMLVEPTEKLDKKKGVCRSDKIVQFGLTDREIGGLERRLKKLLERVESGKIKTF